MASKKPVIALLSPNHHAYSETFIQAHKSYLDGDIRYFSGGLLPDHLEETGALYSLRPPSVRFVRTLEKIKNKLVLEGENPVEKWKLNDLERAFRNHKIDIAFAEYGPTAVRCLKACKDLSIPLIVHFHGFDASASHALDKYASAYRDVFEYATFIIGVSRKMIQDLLKLGAPEEKLIYAPYGPDDAFFKICPHPKNKKFFSVGRFVEKKAPYITILAFKKILQEHPDASLYFGGDGPLWDSCKDLSEACKLEKSVFFLGKLNTQQVQENMADSIAYVQHSVTARNGDSEGTPVAILEAGASGLPVVATRHAGILDVIIDGETGFLVNEKDIDGMASFMSKLAGDVNLAREMGCNARKRIKENFTMGQHILTLNQLIRKTLAES